MKSSLFFSLILVCLISTVSAQKKINQPLCDSLNNWVVVDQIAAKPAEGIYKTMSKDQFQHFRDSVFTTHQMLISKIFDSIGYPGYDVAGEKGAYQFWLLVQHCDKQPEFQQKVLVAMEKEVARKNANPKDYAYLTDRVKINTGQQQVYGTQVTYNPDICQAIPKPLVDSKNVNQRRKTMGLGPIEEYLNFISEHNFEMNKANYESRGIKGPKLVEVPAS
ncbi:DUF6624 domain-containing protein [Pedobacter sp. L105]|uniref:DUF6624 domain-containing protein n=1 Tax=Pedobacter sp. L105 TaxID=1641871 RepID=UPI00131E1C26|nr:DUF6624 domain-containing protein [Pedobacter sp. L105]